MTCLLAAVATLLPAPAASAAGGRPTQECNELGLPLGCTPTTEANEKPTSTTAESVSATSTTAARQVTTTTAPRATSTTAPRATSTTSTTSLTTPTTIADITTSTNLLVPGDGTEGAESTTTTELITTTVGDGDGPSDGTLIALVIAGLAVLAIAVAILTWRYWAATRPEPLDPGSPADR